MGREEIKNCRNKLKEIRKKCGEWLHHWISVMSKRVSFGFPVFVLGIFFK